MNLRTLSACCLAAGLATSSFAQIQIAGSLQVDVNATTAPVGPLVSLPNSGALGGVFIATNNGVAAVTPRVVALGGNGTHGVLLDGNYVSLRHFLDETASVPVYPAATMVGGSPIFSVEAWVYKATVNNETGPVAWGTRANGQNVSCNWGRSIGWGGMSFQGGGYDHSWNTVPSGGKWHHLVWTYDGMGAIKLYCDGVLDKVATQVSALNIATDYNILIGAQHNGANHESHAAGVVGKVRIHDGVLTDAQVANNYTVEVASFTNGMPAQDLVAGPAHRYSFSIPASSDVTGATIIDTGSANGTPAQADAIIRGNAGTVASDGAQVTITMGGSGTQGYIDLPNGLLSSQSSSNGGPGQISFELWVTVNQTRDWVELLYFGSSSAGEIAGPGGSFNGANGIVIPAQVGGNADQSGIRGAVGDWTISARLLGSRKHIVVTWDEATDSLKLYHEGVQVGQFRSNIKMNSIVDVNNWLGRSGWSGDWNTPASYREFRIYNRVINDAEIRRNYLVGPDVVDPGTLVWSGNNNGNWDAATANWLADAAGATFADGKAVQFDDSASGTTTINLAGTVAPASIMVGNDSKSYTIGGIGKISGNTGFIKQGGGTLTFSGSQANDYTGPTHLVLGTTVVTKLADGGAPSALGAAGVNPENLRLSGTLSYQGSAATINRGFYFTGIGATLDVLNSLAVSGKVQTILGGGFTKTGPGTLTFATAGSNHLAGGAFPGFHVAQGTVVFDGTAGGQTNRSLGEFWVGGTAKHPAHLVISNATLSTDNWISVGRGNGDSGHLSTMTLENGNINIGVNGLSMGHNPGRPNLAQQRLTLKSASTVYMPGNIIIGENTGSSASLYLNDNSWLRASTVRLGSSSGSTGAVYLANFAILTNANYTAIGQNGDGYMMMKDNTLFYSTSDFNVADVANSTGKFDLSGNATLFAGSGYVGKNAGCIGVVNMTGGSWVAPNASLQIGGYGQGSFNQSGGIVRVGQWPVVGRYSGGVGELNVSGGAFVQTNLTTDMIVGELGSGTLTVSGSGNVTLATRLRVGAGPGAMGTVNLNAGGTLTTRQVYMADPSAYSTFNFDGGTLVAAPGAASEFMSGLSYVTVLPGGATIDSGDNAINIAQDLNSGGGGLTKLGSGSMRLSGNNTYSGATVVSGGKLTVTSTSIGGGSYSVADNAGLGVAVTSVGMSMPASTLTLGNSASLGIDLGSFGNPQVAPLSVSGVLSRSGTVTVNIEPSSTLSVGQFPLVQYGSLGGAGNFVLGTLPPGVVAELVMNAGNNSIDLNVTTVFLPRWEGLAGGTWDIAVTQNWIDQITMGPQYFYQGTRATFDDNAQGTTTVNIVTDVTPGGVIVDNSLKDYTFNGIGRITGNAGLTKLGTGTLTVSTTNNPYTGETMIDGGGTVVSTVANNLGNNSALVIRDGTLGLGAASQKFGSVTVSNGVIAGTTAAVTSPTFKLGGGTVSASLAGGALTTIGTNTDLVTLLGANTYTGRTVLGGATVSVTNIANGGVVSGIGAATAHPTNLVFNNGALNYDGPSAVTDRGYVVDGGGRLGVLNRLTILGEVVPAAGSFAKSGPGTLVYARPGTNVLSPGGYNVSSGTLVMDGGASTPENYLQTNRVGEMWVGYDGENAAALVLTNTSLGISGWLAMDRGNGTANHSSSVNLYDSYMTVGNFSMGYANNLAGFAASPFLRLFGNSSLTSSGRAFIGENVGGDATLILGGTSKLTLLNEWFALGNSGKGTMVLSNFAQVTLPGDLNLGDIENGNGTLYMYDNVTNLCATLYVGKGANSVGVAYQYGGYMGRSVGGGDWRLANNATATGTYNLFGGIFQPIQQLQVGASGTGTWNQSGGETLLGGYPSAGRFQGSVGTINVSGGVFTQTGEGNLLIIGEEGSGTLNISGSGVVNSLGGLSIAHTATGSGLVNLDGGILSVRSLRSPAGTGILNLNGGVLRANRDEANFVSTTLLMNVMGGGAYLDSGAYNIAIAQPFLDGGSGSGLTKLGAGTVSLGGANTYTGPTAVNEGTLRINGSITAGQVTVQSGGAIGGAGTIPGNVVVNARGAVSPGANTATIGTLNIGGNLTLSGNLVVDVAKTGTPTSDLTVVGGTLVNNGTGTISVSNLGDSLANGDTFQLFNKPVVNGQTLTFASSPGLGLTWTNQLAVNGTIAVIKGTVPVSTNIVGTIVGNNLELSWPSDYVGWRLLGQTNALTTGLSDNWVTVPGSTTTNRVVLPLDKNNGSSFFRLVYP